MSIVVGTRLASHREADATNNTADGEAAFYHLGDVVYYNGETSEYYPQLFTLRILSSPDRGYPTAIP